MDPNPLLLNFMLHGKFYHNLKAQNVNCNFQVWPLQEFSPCKQSLFCDIYLHQEYEVVADAFASSKDVVIAKVDADQHKSLVCVFPSCWNVTFLYRVRDLMSMDSQPSNSSQRVQPPLKRNQFFGSSSN